jgi:hypothetical protein
MHFRRELSIQYSTQSLFRCCYIMVDFATAALQNSIFITQQMCLIMILFHDCSMINKESNKYFFSLNCIGFLVKGKLISIPNPFVMQPLQTPPLCRSTTHFIVLLYLSNLLYSYSSEPSALLKKHRLDQNNIVNNK